MSEDVFVQQVVHWTQYCSELENDQINFPKYLPSRQESHVTQAGFNLGKIYKNGKKPMTKIYKKSATRQKQTIR